MIATTGSQAAERAAPETRWQSVPLQTTVAGPDFRLMLPLLIGLSGCVLLLACSNLANLQLVRAIGRSREFAVRGALGASRLQLIRPLVVEALVLAVAGAAGALLVAHGVHLAIAAATTNEYGESFPLAIDARVLAWSALAATAAAVTFAIAPVLFAWRLDLHATLKSGGRTGSGRQPRVQQVLIVGQFAAALALLVAAAFFARGLSRAHGDASGWEARAVTLGTIVLPANATPPRADFPRALLQELARLPGAAHVSLSSASPYFPWSEKRTLVAAGPNATDRTPSVSINLVSAGYFSTYGTPLRRGRTFDERDQPDGARVAIVSESLARVLAPDADVLGRRLAWSAEQAPQEVEIVGIVADVLPADPSAPRLALQAYVPLAQEPSARLVIGVRAAAGVAPDSAVGAIRQLVYRLSPDLPVRGLQTAETAIARGLGDMRVFRDLLASFGVLGLALAALGISGMVARNLAQRRPEFAVRAALGAAPPDLLRLALGRSLGQASLGTALGAIAGFFITRLLSAAFPGLPGDGILIVVATSAALLLFALLASWWPARRAARVDPALALRGD